MVYFSNKNINDNESLQQILTKFLGIGSFLAEGFCRDLGLHSRIRFRQLSTKQITLLGDKILKDQKNPKQEDFARKRYENIKILVQIRSYKGYRHKARLPLRGQRTRTNSKTAKKHNAIVNRSK